MEEGACIMQFCYYTYCRAWQLQKKSNMGAFVLNASTCMVALWPDEPSIQGTNAEVHKVNAGVECGM